MEYASGGGGWNCYEAFACARENNLSVALFAPGWIAENFLHRDIIMNSLRSIFHFLIKIYIITKLYCICYNKQNKFN